MRLAGKPSRTLLLCVAPVLVVANLVTVGLLFESNGSGQIDLEVYRLGALAWSAGGDLYGKLPANAVGYTLPFIYPPIAAVLFRPVAGLPVPTAEALNCLVSIALIALVIVLASRRLPSAMLARVGGWPLVALVALPIALWLEPVRETLRFGQINIVLMAFVMVDCLITARRWPRGVLIGLAAAIKLTPLVFLLYFLLRRDFRTIVVSVVSFCGITVIGFLAAPKDSVTYWTQALFKTTKMVGTAYGTNQSLFGVFARVDVDKTLQNALWLASSAAVLVLATLVMRQAILAGNTVAAVAVNGVAGLLVSPISWSHHWVMIIPAVALVAGSASWRPWLAAVPLLVIFLVGPHWLVPTGAGKEMEWSFGEQLIGNGYVLSAIVVLVVLYWLGVRRQRQGETAVADVKQPDLAAAARDS